MEFIRFGVVRPTAIGAIVDLLALPLVENLGLLALPQIFEDTESLSYFTSVFKLQNIKIQFSFLFSIHVLTSILIY